MSRLVCITCDAPAFESGQHIGFCGRRTFGRDTAEAEAAAVAAGWTVNPDRCPGCRPGGGPTRRVLSVTRARRGRLQ